jgi:mRNA interferase MazF
MTPYLRLREGVSWFSLNLLKNAKCWTERLSKDSGEPGLKAVLKALSKTRARPSFRDPGTLPWEVLLSPNEGVPSLCVLKPEWIRSVERHLLGPWISSFPEDRWGEVATALLDVFGLQ